MSLITLTFGDRGNAYNASPHAFISTPEARMNEEISSEGAFGKAVVKKTCRFFSQEDLYIVAEVEEGVLGAGMEATINGRKVNVVDVESKHGHAARKGMTAGITLKGVSESELRNGDVLIFEKN